VANNSAGGAAPAHVTLDNVVFSGDLAIGGDGGSSGPSCGGGGGGLGGNGGPGGFGGGDGTVGGGTYGGGGGGLGAGGDIFVMAGASLIMTGGSLGAGSVSGGLGAGGAGNGQALGADIFAMRGASVTIADVAPTITGTVASQATTLEAPVTPFANVTIDDANTGATDTLTITLSNGAGGTLVDGAGFSGLKTLGSAVYPLSGTASEITTELGTDSAFSSELDALVFTPKAAYPSASATTTFTLSDVSSAYVTPAVDSRTTVIDNDSGAISVSAAHLAANIDGINADAQVTSITLTDSGILQLNLTDAQATGDTAALNKITNQVFEVLAPAMAPTFYVGGNGATGPALTLTASNSAVVERAASNVALTGSNDSVSMGAWSDLSISGSTDAITGTTGDKITLQANSSVVLTGSSDTVTMGAGSNLSVSGVKIGSRRRRATKSRSCRGLTMWSRAQASQSARPLQQGSGSGAMASPASWTTSTDRARASRFRPLRTWPSPGPTIR
jgi:hypothetical protein